MIGPVPLVFSELVPGDRVHGIACLWSCQIRRTRQGKPFFQLEFRDETSTIIGGVMWDADPGSVFECPMVVVVEGEAGEFQGTPQIKAFTLRPTGDDVAGYLPSTYRQVDDLVDEFTGIIEMIDDDDLCILVEKCLEAAPGFWTAPAAIRFHGAYRGGLLEHTLHVVRVCLNAADIYGERVNRDLLIASAMLHDIGKWDAYDTPESRQPGEYERLIGHIIRGTMLVEHVAAEIEYEGAIPLADVLHPIISHHGEHEYGAPVVPGTAEALILSAADTLDADVTGYFDLWREKLESEDWTYSNQRKRWVRRPPDGTS
ncbi:MAG: HD domain-containing protein [Thermomicrobiaceae bacterium]